MTLAEAKMWRPGTGLMTTALLSRLKRKALPHAGVNVVERAWLMDVAQLSRPRQDCKAFLSAFLLFVLVLPV